MLMSRPPVPVVVDGSSVVADRSTAKGQFIGIGVVHSVIPALGSAHGRRLHRGRAGARAGGGPLPPCPARAAGAGGPPERDPDWTDALRRTTALDATAR